MKNSIFSLNEDGKKTWKRKEGDFYQVTGVDKDGKRYVKHCDTWFNAMCTNDWNGSKWLCRDGKRYLISRMLSEWNPLGHFRRP